jgi:hypothetical protein
MAIAAAALESAFDRLVPTTATPVVGDVLLQAE